MPASDPQPDPGPPPRASDALRVRRTDEPLPAPLEGFEIHHPAVPQNLDGCRILHIADLHARARRSLRGPTRPRGFPRLQEALGDLRVDMLCLTGDAADRPGDEAAAVDAVGRLVEALPEPRLGRFGSFGNHDHHDARAALKAAVTGVTWLDDDAARRPELTILGTGEPEDLLHAALGERAPLSIALAHDPIGIYPASDLGIPLVLSGHTHGGQIRPHARRLLHTSTDLLGHQATGVLARRSTICCVTRGLGATVIGVRLNCPPQAPVYTLRRSTEEFEETGEETSELRTLLAW